jgi:hypothetical protein
VIAIVTDDGEIEPIYSRRVPRVPPSVDREKNPPGQPWDADRTPRTAHKGEEGAGDDQKQQMAADR